MSEAHMSRTACSECEVILCSYCWKQWRHEGGGHPPEHIIAPPEPREAPSPFTPKRQRSRSEREERRHKRCRPESPNSEAAAAPAPAQRKASRLPSRLEKVRKLSKASRKGVQAREKNKKDRKARMAAARAGATTQAKKRPRDDGVRGAAPAPRRRKR